MGNFSTYIGKTQKFHQALVNRVGLLLHTSIIPMEPFCKVSVGGDTTAVFTCVWDRLR